MSTTSSYRFVWRPWWILSHVVLIAAVVAMVNLGFWQLRRLDDKKDRNAVAEANEALPTAPIAEVPPDRDPLFRSVTATGTYDTSNEIIIRNRSQRERPGVWVATPLRLNGGIGGVVVIRGFLPTSGPIDAVPADAAAPTGEVTVTGYLQATQTKGSFGASDAADGHLTSMARVDVGRIAQQTGYDLHPAFLTLTSSQPRQGGDFPEPVEKLELDEGPHLSYAVQWFLFSVIAVVGYPFILRRRARQGDRDGGDGDADGAEDASADGERVFASRA